MSLEGDRAMKSFTALANAYSYLIVAGCNVEVTTVWLGYWTAETLESGSGLAQCPARKDSQVFIFPECCSMTTSWLKVAISGQCSLGFVEITATARVRELLNYRTIALLAGRVSDADMELADNRSSRNMKSSVKNNDFLVFNQYLR